MIRWKYIIPRMMIGCVIFAIAYFGTDPFMRWAIIESTQSATGAKVEIDAVNLDFANGRMTITELHMANPRDAMENMFQAELAEFDLDTAMLLRKKLVIEKASLKNIQFSTPRTKSGALAERKGRALPDFGWATDPLKENVKSLSKSWLRDLENNAVNSIEQNFETVGVVKRLNGQWTQRYKQQQAKTQEIKKQIASLKLLVEEPHRNPLRELERIQIASRNIQTLKRQMDDIKREIKLMNEQFAIDQQAVETAKANDTRKIQNAAELFSIDADSTSDLLLGEERSRYVREALDWVNWFRNVVPDPEQDFYPSRGRGRDIVFKGLQRRPDFLVRHADLSGKGMIGGQRYQFSGSAKDLTNSPDWHDSPAKFFLSADGDKHLEIEAIVDRRGPQSIDHLRIILPGIEVPGKMLGSKESLLVNVSPGKLNADIQIKMVGDSLTGTMILRQDEIDLNLQQLSPSVGGMQLAESVNQQLSAIDGYTIEIDLSGTVQDMEISMKSDLGNRISSVFGDAANTAIKHNIEMRQQQFNRMVDAEVQKLTLKHSSEVQSILRVLDGDVSHVASLQKIMTNGSSNWRKFR